MQATYKKYVLNFKRPSGTSRGVLTTKETWFIKIEDDGRVGYGECGILRGLSVDDRPDYEEKLKWACDNINLGEDELWKQLVAFPSIQFGIEIAFKSLQSENNFELFPSAFTRGTDAISINGLIWMGEKSFMKSQIEDKLQAGFRCIKMKIGAIDFETEIELLKYIRSQYSSEEIELRVDANGAFTPETALERLKRLSELELHSIEQPIAQGNWEDMASLCEKTPLSIALDEELIGVFTENEKQKLLETIKPQYLIFKPSLIGGFKGTEQWIDFAESMNIGWWNTSALESNIGLNAISQFTYSKEVSMPQGLGTGSLYTNNIKSPLVVRDGKISYHPDLNWEFKL